MSKLSCRFLLVWSWRHIGPWTHGDSIFSCSCPRYELVTCWETLSCFNPIEEVIYRSHGIVPQSACTFDKAQFYFIVDWMISHNEQRSWPGIHLKFEMVNVDLILVKDVRLVPTLPGQSLDWHFNLRLNQNMLLWRARGTVGPISLCGADKNSCQEARWPETSRPGHAGGQRHGHARLSRGHGRGQSGL